MEKEFKVGDIVVSLCENFEMMYEIESGNIDGEIFAVPGSVVMRLIGRSSWYFFTGKSLYTYPYREHEKQLRRKFLRTMK